MDSCTVTHQTPLYMEFSRQEYWSGLPFPTPGDLPDPEMEIPSLVSPAQAGRFFATAPPWKPLFLSIPIIQTRVKVATQFKLFSLPDAIQGQEVNQQNG